MMGMKVATTWMPPPMPSASPMISHSGVPSAASAAAVPSTKMVPAAMSKKSMKAPPMLMVNMNIRYITTRKIGTPSARLSITRSSRSERLRVA